MTMSCLHDQKLLLAPASPEKSDAVATDKALARTLVQDADQQQQQQEQPQQTTGTSSFSTGRKRAASTVSCAEPRWEPTEAELDALSMHDFDVIGVLGVGTYGVVKLARHVASGASVALKVLSKEHIVSMRQEKHILRERSVHLELQHAFIARLYGTFQDDDCLYLAIEYLPGGELWSLVYSDFDNNDGSDGEGERVVPDALAGSSEPRAASNGDMNEPSDDARAVCGSGVDDSEQAAGEKDTEARGGSPTETTDDTEVVVLSKRVTLKLVLDDEQLTSQQQPITITSSSSSSEDAQQQQYHLVISPSRRRGPNSPAHALRLDAKSRGLLRNAHGGLKEDHAVFYLASILCALEYLHAQGLLYRDLKLENLVLDRSGYPKVLDFGFAKPNATSTANGSGGGGAATAPLRNMTLCGSMDYMAPEILRHEPHDERVDIWSFGIIMYELLLGKTPFYHENPREVGRKITSEPVAFPSSFEREHATACDLVRKLLVKAPDGRLRSMRAIKSHAFFAQQFPDAASWDALARKERKAPFAPKLAGPFDTSFFETMDDAAQDELEDAVEPYFEDGSHIFRGF